MWLKQLGLISVKEQWVRSTIRLLNEPLVKRPVRGVVGAGGEKARLPNYMTLLVIFSYVTNTSLQYSTL